MNWTLAIERQHEALKRILAALVAMAGLSETRTHLPRRLHRAVLGLLRPAESAARRLIIIAARGLVVSLPKQRPPRPRAGSSYVRNGVGTGIILPRGMRPPVKHPPAKPGFRRLPLADPLSRFRRRARRQSSAQPAFEFYEPRDATRLGFRLQAVGDVLDNLPAYARRFARWRARRDAEGAQTKARRAAGRIRRTSPLKPGRPPGSRKKRTHEVQDVLKDLHSLAFEVLEKPDTS